MSVPPPRTRSLRSCTGPFASRAATRRVTVPRRLLGVGAIAGVAVMVVSMYIANKTTRAIVVASNDRQPHSDNRVQQIMELLQGIRVVKYFCWEDAKAERVSRTREVEMSHVRRQEMLYALNRRADASFNN